MGAFLPNQLMESYGNGARGYETLVDYGDWRYHLAIQRRADADARPDTVENATLQKIYDAKDDKETEQAADACMALLRPLLEDDYVARSNGSASAIPPDQDGIIRLKPCNVNGVLQAWTHDWVLEYPPNPPLQTSFPGVPQYPSSDIERLNEVTMDIFKTRLNGKHYCLKSVHRHPNECFIREVTTLMKCSYSKIARLTGVTVNGDGKIDGMLTDWIECAKSLDTIDTITPAEASKWIIQIR
jgi:hypothetical protein